MLNDLNFLLEKKNASLSVIYGRKRIGKNRLIEAFLKELKFIHAKDVLLFYLLKFLR